jgi:hypothetical protein
MLWYRDNGRRHELGNDVSIPRGSSLWSYLALTTVRLAYRKVFVENRCRRRAIRRLFY